MLVGYGTAGPSVTRRKRHPSPGGAHENLATVVGAAAVRGSARDAGGDLADGAPAAAAPPTASRPDSGVPVIAKPPIRKLAKDLGVDLARSRPPVSSARSRATT